MPREQRSRCGNHPQGRTRGGAASRPRGRGAGSRHASGQGFKVGGRLVRHARYDVLQLAESHLTKNLFGQTIGRILRLAWHPT